MPCRQLLLGLVLSSVAACGAAARADEKPENIALGAKYTLHPGPNYGLCTDPLDKIQLTDGQSTRAYFWTQKGTVGWVHASYATVTVDLKRVEPIGGVALTTAAGVAGVCWPGEVRILTSDDGKTFFDRGDLLALDVKRNGPLPKKYSIRRLVTNELHARGRYVTFLMLPLAGGAYTFVDEVEVFRGPAKLLSVEPSGKPIRDVREYADRGRIERAVRIRWRDDATALAELIERSALETAAKTRLRQRLAAIREQLAASCVAAGDDFKAILPIGSAHAQLFQLQADVWRALKAAPLTAWVPNTWDPLELVGTLPTAPARAMEVHLMRGEWRAAAVNLANSTDTAQQVALRLEGLPGGPMPKIVSVHDVPWTDTSHAKPVAAALPEAARSAAGWTVSVLPGLVHQVWLTWHVTDLAPGDYRGTLVAESAGHAALRIPVRLKVWPPKFPTATTLGLGGWCYTNGRGAYGVNPENRPAFLKHVKQRFVNTPWAGGGVLLNFKLAGNPPQVTLNTAELDDWIAQWPDARRYMVFLSAGRTIAGTDMDSPEFESRVAAWISAWVRHLARKGIGPDRLGLLIHDEPNESTDVAPIVAWARAVRKAQPQVVIWEDPTYRDPTKAPAAMLEACDVLCPNRPMWLANKPAFERVYLGQRQRGRQLNLYSCSGPARLLDPYSYYRLQAWQCWQIGATASFFWALGDNSRVSSWCEYLAQAGPFTPLFIDQRTIVAGKQMEAIRESAEDYEYLVMLRRAAERAKAAGRSGPAVAEAQRLLTAGVREVLDAAPDARQIEWLEPKDRRGADQLRVKILECLMTLGG
jgi:hypothetical protein